MKPKNRINKRADISVTILVLGVFALCTLTLFSFYYSDISGIRNPSTGLDLMEKMNSFLEMHFSPEEVQNEFREIKGIFLKEDIRKNRFFIAEKSRKTKIIFYVKYYLD